MLQGEITRGDCASLGSVETIRKGQSAEAEGIARGCGKDTVRVVAVKGELVYAWTGDSELAISGQLGE